MVSFHLLPSGSIRFFITIAGSRHYFTTKYRTKPEKWVDQRVSGRNSITINQELDRIEEEVNEWASFNPVETYSKDAIKVKLHMIANRVRSNSPQRKSIQEYLNSFVDGKKTVINGQTQRLLKKDSINHYLIAFDKLMNFESVELEDVTEGLYHRFTAHLLETYKPNTVGKYIRKIKSFFTWCESQGLPINPAYKTWKSFSQETDESTRALNSAQLDRIYRIEVDPIDVYKLAKELHDKTLDGKQVDDLSRSIKLAANQMVAVASIGSHITDFYLLDDSNVFGDVIKYRRIKNNILCVAPFQDNANWHAREFANLNGGPLFQKIPLSKLRYYLTYVQALCDLPFKITPSNFRKTFASIIVFESTHAGRYRTAMKALGHKKESTFEKYLGIQDDDLRQNHSEIFDSF